MINCQYCNQPCRKVAPAKHDVQRQSYWQCDYHGGTVVKYLYGNELSHGVHGAHEWQTTILVFHFKEATYHACFFYNNIIPEKFRVDKVRNKPGQIGADSVFSLDFYPDITPENVQKKCAMYMVFS